MQKLFGHPVEKGMQIAQEVDTRGQAIVMTTTRELAELKRDQIHAYGKDDLIAGCKGSMSATIEPVGMNAGSTVDRRSSKAFHVSACISYNSPLASRPSPLLHCPLLRTVTLGCKVNQYETEFVRQALNGIGYQDAGPGERADLCIVNTCTVTHEGDSKSRQTIRQLAARNPGHADRRDGLLRHPRAR